ncbi:hypothetical protein HBDW_45330 [Herbaspirillum sp. DW155]|uniref:hypothetical protein n=1 Tax=Herbaspirillum sp. DW155 TaxID=3095609 RepID=UPI00308CAD41|nr:hypothetical protein HBDW_45330 [Herbaspirillum sp. DW155]
MGSKNPKRIELEKIAQFLAAISEETVLDSVRRKTDLFDKSYKSIFPRGLQAERVFLAWLIAQAIEKERASMLSGHSQPDLIIKAILGIHGTPWGIYVANVLIEQSGSDLSKLSLKKMDHDDFKAAIDKYAKKALELYSEIAVNIIGGDDASQNARNEIRVRPFLERLKRTLGLRVNKFNSWKLPKLNAVIASIK